MSSLTIHNFFFFIVLKYDEPQRNMECINLEKRKYYYTS